MESKKEDVLKKLLSKNGYQRLISDAKKSAKDRESKIETCKKIIAQYKNKIRELKIKMAEYNGDLRTFNKIVDTLEFLKKQTGLDDLINMIEMDKKTHEIIDEKIEIINDEIRKRKEEGKLCMYRDFETKKWCNRLLKGKEARESGYCKVHRDILEK